MEEQLCEICGGTGEILDPVYTRNDEPRYELSPCKCVYGFKSNRNYFKSGRNIVAMEAAIMAIEKAADDLKKKRCPVLWRWK